MQKSRFWAAITAIFSLFSMTVGPALADPPIVVTSRTLSPSSSPLILSPLVGQSTCAVEVTANSGLTLSFKSLARGAFVPAAGTSPDQSVVNVTSTTSTGTFLFACGGASAFEVVPSGSGSAAVSIIANSGVSKVIGAGVNGGRTTVAGSSPINVTNSGSTATVSISPLPIPLIYGGTGATALPAGCIQSNGTKLVPSVCATSGVAVDVQAGSGIAVATPGPGVFVVSNTVPQTVVSPGTNIVVSNTSTNPVVSTTDAPSFGGPLTAQSLTGTNLTSGKCVQAGAGGILSTTADSCAIAQTITAGTNIVITGSTSAPVVSTTNAPTFTGPLSALSLTATALTSGQCVHTTTGGLLAVTGTDCASPGVTSVSGTGNIASTGGTTPVVSITNAPTFSGQLTAGSIIDNNLTASSCVGADGSKQLVASSCVSSVTGLSNINVTAGSTPVVSITSAPTFTNATVSSITSGQCVQASTGGLLFHQYLGFPCGGGNLLNTSFTMPAVGSTVTNISINGEQNMVGGLLRVIVGGANVIMEVVNRPSYSVVDLKNVYDFGTSTGQSVPSGTQADAVGVDPALYLGGFVGIGGITGTGNVSVTAGATPVVSVTAAPTFAQITDSGLTSGNCVQASTGGLLTTTGSACGSGSGGVTSVTASGNLASSGGTTPNITITAAPTFGQVTDSGLTSGNCVQASTAGLLTTIAGACGTGNGTLTGLTAGNDIVVGTGPTPSVAVTNAPSFTGPLSASTLTGTGLTSGNCVQASTGGLLITTSASCGAVASVTGGTGITVTAGPTPVVSLTTPVAVTSGGTGSTTITNGSCITATSGTTYGSAPFECLGTKTSATFVVPAVGSSVTVTTTTSRGNVKNNIPVTISDNTTSMMGFITTGAASTSLTVTNTGMLSGSVGATVATGAAVLPGAASNLTSITGTGNISVTALPSPVVSITAAPTFGQITDSGLTSGNCVQASTGGLLTTVAAACGTGTVTSVSGSGNISSTGGAAPTVSITNAPTFTGTATVGNLIDSGLTASTCVGANGSKQLVSSSSCVTSVSGTGNISSTGGSTPTVSVTNAPTFTGALSALSLTATGLTSGQCVQTTSGGLLTTTGSACSGGGGGSSVYYDLSSQFGLSSTAPPFTTQSSYFRHIANTTVINHLSVSCLPYNNTDANNGQSDYTPVDATGLGGGTITFGVANSTVTAASPTVVGSVTIADSPQGGPYVNSGTSTLGSPLTLNPNDNIFAYVTAITGTASQSLISCSASIGT